MDLTFNRETALSRFLSIIFLLGVFPVVFFYIGMQFEEAVRASSGEQFVFSYPSEESPSFIFPEGM